MSRAALLLFLVACSGAHEPVDAAAPSPRLRGSYDVMFDFGGDRADRRPGVPAASGMSARLSWMAFE